MKRIITHSGTFHADEITAIALLKIFLPDQYTIERIGHQENIPLNAHFVIDVGRKHDNITRFDHHQWEGGKSSAGLIWDYLKLELDYPQISDLILLVDQNDVGIRKAKSYEYSRILGAFNTKDIYDDVAQAGAFNEALQVAIRVIQNMKDGQDERDITGKIIADAVFAQSTDILEVPNYLIGWDGFLNGQTTPHIRAIVWPKSPSSKEWHAQVIPKKSGEYGLHGARFEPDNSMTFVHSNGFFCVAPDKETMLTYLAKD